LKTRDILTRRANRYKDYITKSQDFIKTVKDTLSEVGMEDAIPSLPDPPPPPPPPPRIEVRIRPTLKEVAQRVVNRNNNWARLSDSILTRAICAQTMIILACFISVIVGVLSSTLRVLYYKRTVNDNHFAFVLFSLPWLIINPENMGSAYKRFLYAVPNACVTLHGVSTWISIMFIHATAVIYDNVWVQAASHSLGVFSFSVLLNFNTWRNHRHKTNLDCNIYILVVLSVIPLIGYFLLNKSIEEFYVPV
jgi:hypothetical protein